MHPVPSPSPVARQRYLWLLCLPFVWQLGLAPLANEITWKPFGLPFPMAWQMAGVVFSSLLFALVFQLDRKAGLEEEEQAFMAAMADKEYKDAHA